MSATSITVVFSDHDLELTPKLSRCKGNKAPHWLPLAALSCEPLEYRFVSELPTDHHRLRSDGIAFRPHLPAASVASGTRVIHLSIGATSSHSLLVAGHSPGPQRWHPAVRFFGA